MIEIVTSVPRIIRIHLNIHDTIACRFFLFFLHPLESLFCRRRFQKFAAGKQRHGPVVCPQSLATAGLLPPCRHDPGFPAPLAIYADGYREIK
jgi:hypothetical protein